MHEPTKPRAKKVVRSEDKAPQGIDLKTAYSILMKAQLRNHPEILEARKERGV